MYVFTDGLPWNVNDESLIPSLFEIESFFMVLPVESIFSKVIGEPFSKVCLYVYSFPS